MFLQRSILPRLCFTCLRVLLYLNRSSDLFAMCACLPFHKVYRDSMTDPQGVKGMIELFDQFQKMRWRFSIGQRVPQTDEKKAGE